MLTTPVPRKIQISRRRIRIWRGERISAKTTKMGAAKSNLTKQICIGDSPAADNTRIKRLMIPHKIPDRRIESIDSTRRFFFMSSLYIEGKYYSIFYR